MTTIWCDTETTGLKPETGGAFEIAVLVAVDGTIISRQVFHLNPLSETIVYDSEAAKVHGIREETIRSYPPCETVIRQLESLLCEIMDQYNGGQKMVFAGYKCTFDYDHLAALFTRCGFNLSDYFCKQFDVMQMVKRAVAQKVIPRMANLRLSTVCNGVGVALDNAHTALADVEAARNVCIALFKKGVKT